MKKLIAVAMAAVAAGLTAAADVVGTVDFREEVGVVRPELHSSGLTPRSSERAIQNDDEAIRSMGFMYARTHDWALVNAGQRVIDYQYIFPLIDKDAKDPANYYFEPSDHLLELSRNVGLKTYYRLGTSIEHTGKVHFNAKVPADFDKVAEVFAATVRHYNRGWANGKRWDIGYWEIWGEPDGMQNLWCEGDRGFTSDEKKYMEDARYMRDKFIRFFVICLKRLKSEFPEVKVGGPGLCWYWPEYFEALLRGCKDAGVAPDFISWHYYGANPDEMTSAAEKARKLCDSFGFTKTEIIIDEWHYILSWDGIHGRNSTPAMVKRALDGPTGHNQIDSAAFTLTSLVKFQSSALDQAYWYGCFPQGNWGYMDQYKQFNKNYYALKMFGDLVREYGPICASRPAKDTVSTLAVKAKDGKRLGLLVVDYRGTGQVLELDVAGAEKAKHASALVLDHTRDNFPVDVSWRNGRLTLVKPDKNSSAWFVTFAETASQDPKPPLCLTLTFDDGTRDHYTIAVPELEKRGWRGLFCIITDKVGTDGHVTWDDVRDMVRRGHEIAAHTVSHVDLAALARAGNTNEIRRQVAECCEKIKAETGVRPRLLCLPFTRWTPAVVEIAKTCGVETMLVKRNCFGDFDRRVDSTVDGLRAQNAERTDFLVHGICPEGGGWKPFASVEAFRGYLDDIQKQEKAGKVRVVPYFRP